MAITREILKVHQRALDGLNQSQDISSVDDTLRFIKSLVPGRLIVNTEMIDAAVRAIARNGNAQVDENAVMKEFEKEHQIQVLSYPQMMEILNLVQNEESDQQRCINVIEHFFSFIEDQELIKEDMDFLFELAGISDGYKSIFGRQFLAGVREDIVNCLEDQVKLEPKGERGGERKRRREESPNEEGPDSKKVKLEDRPRALSAPPVLGQGVEF